jgi:class 3 adenylate cyclase
VQKSAASLSTSVLVFAALAQPGEVLVSTTVRDLVAGSGLQFEERGTHTLKGVPGTWPLYAVARSGQV